MFLISFVEWEQKMNRISRLKIYHISTYSANFLAWREAVTLTFYSRIFSGPWVSNFNLIHGSISHSGRGGHPIRRALMYINAYYTNFIRVQNVNLTADETKYED